MKLCPQCEFIYEDDQRFCDMDGKELVYDVSRRVFASSTAALPAQFPGLRAVSTVTETPDPTPSPTPGPPPSPASLPANPSLRRQSRSLAVAALAAVVLVALLFVVYYARTHSSRTRKANRTSSQAVSQSDQSNSGSHSQLVAPASDTQPAATDSGSESATSFAETTSSEEAPELKPEAGRPASLARSQSSSSLPTASEKSGLRTLQSASPVAARASSESNRASVVIRLTNGASIKADEAWEKKEGIWYRQAGMVTFLKRSRVRSIQRFTPANRSQTERRPGTSIAQNQPRVGKAEATTPKKDSKVTSFLKKTGRVLKKPFKF